MSLQTIIDNATYVEFNIREQFSSTLSRSGHYKTADRNVNVYSFKIGMHDGLKYSTNRSVVQDIYTTGSTNEANVSLNNNSGMNYLTAYQGSLSGSQQAEVVLVGTSGSEIYVDQTGITGNTSGYTHLVKKGDFIQPKGNTDTYRYPYQVTSDVTFNIAESNTTIPVHRPVLSQSGVALTSGGVKLGNDVTWRVKITNLPKYTIVPHDLLQFTDDFELVEVIT